MLGNYLGGLGNTYNAGSLGNLWQPTVTATGTITGTDVYYGEDGTYVIGDSHTTHRDTKEDGALAWLDRRVEEMRVKL